MLGFNIFECKNCGSLRNREGIWANCLWYWKQWLSEKLGGRLELGSKFVSIQDLRGFKSKYYVTHLLPNLNNLDWINHNCKYFVWFRFAFLKLLQFQQQIRLPFQLQFQLCIRQLTLSLTRCCICNSANTTTFQILMLPACEISWAPFQG